MAPQKWCQNSAGRPVLELPSGAPTLISTLTTCCPCITTCKYWVIVEEYQPRPWSTALGGMSGIFWGKIDNQSRTQKSVWLRIKIELQIILWQQWVIDAQRSCHDRLAGGRKTLRQNDWFLLFDVSAWLTCDVWLHLQNPFCVDSCNDPKHFICHIWAALWQLLVKRIYFYDQNLIPYSYIHP